MSWRHVIASAAFTGAGLAWLSSTPDPRFLLVQSCNIERSPCVPSHPRFRFVP